MKRLFPILLSLLMLASPAYCETDDVITALREENEALREENEHLRAELASYVAITFKGGSVSVFEVREEYARRAAVYEKLGIAESEYADELKADVLQTLAEDAILRMKAQELGIWELSEEDVASLMESAAEQYKQTVASYAAYMSREAARKYLENEGITQAVIYEDLLSALRLERLIDAVTPNITVTDDDVRTLYDRKAVSDRSSYENDSEAFEAAVFCGETVCYRPAGFFRVEFLLLPYTQEETEAYPDMTDEQRSALAADVSERYAGTLSTVRSGVLPESTALTDPSALLYSLPVRAGSTVIDTPLVSAVLTLAEGEASEPLFTESGCWIAYRGETLPEGTVPFEEVSSALSETALELAKSQAFNTLCEQWIEESDIRYNDDVF